MPLDVEILELTNAFRQEHALPALARHLELTGIATRHAAAVADSLEPFSHRGAPERFAACSTRCLNVAENLARSDGFCREELPGATVAGWCSSEGHRRNLLGPFDVCGIGWAANENGTIFITQLLALLDERDAPRLGVCLSQAADKAIKIVASTPALCAALGLVVAGPGIGFVGGGVLGGALSLGAGLRVSSLPRVAGARAANWLQPKVCTCCGQMGELLLDSSGTLLCADCHPTPTDTNVWQYID